MRKKMINLLTAVLLFSIATPFTVGASSLDDINAEEESVRNEVVTLEDELNEQMESINTLNEDISKNEEDIVTQEAKIAETSENIATKEAELEERLEAAKKQAQSVQMNPMNQNAIMMILNAESFSEAANMVVGLNTLFSANTNDIETANQEAQALNEMKATQEDQKTALAETKAELEEQKLAMDESVKETQKLIEANQTELAEISEKRAAKEARLAEIEQSNALAAKEAEEAAKAETKQAEAQPKETNHVASVSTNNSSNKAVAKPISSTSQPAKQQAASSSQQSNGRQVTVNATAYSTNQAGLSDYTATGINLRQNPYVIAVDPSVIPLGSMVEVPGYGVRIAGDTGGAIKGNRIDIHMTNLNQALAFGRRSMTVTVLN